MRDRKELLRCVVERILIEKNDRQIDGTIVWRSGARSQFHLHRGGGVYELVRRLHAQGSTVREIQRWLAAGDPETGQRWTFSKNYVHVILKKLGVRAHQRRAYDLRLLDHIRRLHEQGLAAPAIADELNASGSTTPLGRRWNRDSVRHALNRNPAALSFATSAPSEAAPSLAG